MTAIRRLRLQNFKSWKDSGWLHFAPITAFYGSNSSGKTSILQSLLLAKQTTESPDRARVLDLGNANSYVDLGTAKDIQYLHSNESNVGLAIEWTESDEFVVADPLLRARKRASTILSGHELGLETEIEIQGNAVEVLRTTYRVDQTSFSMTRRETRDGYDLTSEPTGDFAFVRAQGRPWPLPKPARFYGFPDQVRLYFQNASFLSDLELRFEQEMGRLKYLGPLRDHPQRQYLYSGGAPAGVGRRGELAVDALVAATNEGRRVSRGFASGRRHHRLRSIPVEQLVAEWLRELGLIHSFRVVPLDPRETLYAVQVKRRPSSAEVLLTDVGFGVSQVLPVLVLLALSEEGDTVMLEQPEIHLHPSVQSGLADIIVETALARKVQVVLESHSEHLLRRLQRRIAERDLNRGLVIEPTDVSVYFCDFSDGQSVASQLEVDLFGAIANWPKDFFGDPDEDPYAMLQARVNRSE